MNFVPKQVAQATEKKTTGKNPMKVKKTHEGGNQGGIRAEPEAEIRLVQIGKCTPRSHADICRQLVPNVEKGLCVPCVPELYKSREGRPFVKSLSSSAGIGC